MSRRARFSIAIFRIAQISVIYSEDWDEVARGKRGS